MYSIQRLFGESQGEPILFDGYRLVSMDLFPIASDAVYRVTFESSNSSWRQGVGLQTRGEVKVNSQALKQGAVFWQDTAPTTVEFRVRTKHPFIGVYNVWDSGFGLLESRKDNAAMIVDEVPNGRRYRCSDGGLELDFTNIVFRIESI